MSLSDEMARETLNLFPPLSECTELFPTDAFKQDSPRLAWVKKHDVRTHCIPERNMPMARDECIQKWSAWFGPEDVVEIIEDDGPEALGYGDTEEEAMRDLAIRHSVKLWNEETDL